MYMYGNTESALTTESLDGYLPNLVGITYSWPPYWILGQICQGADPGQENNRSMRDPGPFSKGFLLQSWRATATNIMYSNGQWSKSIWEEVLLFLVPFWRHVFDMVWCIGLCYFDFFSFKYSNKAKCLIYINLCTFHVKKNSLSLQWYSCARYKAPEPLVTLCLFPFVLTSMVFQTYHDTSRILNNILLTNHISDLSVSRRRRFKSSSTWNWWFCLCCRYRSTKWCRTLIILEISSWVIWN